MTFQGVLGSVDLEIERMGNRLVVNPLNGAKLLLIDACNAILDFARAAGAQAITVTQEEGPTLNIQSNHSRDLFDSDGKSYKVAPIGAYYEISSAAQGGR